MMKHLFVVLWLALATVASAEKMTEPVLTAQDRYFELAVRRNGAAGLAKAADAVFKADARQPGRLNEFAWRIMTDEFLLHRDVAVALRAAREAMKLSGEKNAAIVDTYARALFMTGTTNEALESQRAAIALCRDPKQRLELKETLLDYQNPARLTPAGWEDERVFRDYVDKSVALVESQRTVRVAELLAKTDVQPCQVKLLPVSRRPVSSEQLYERVLKAVFTGGDDAASVESSPRRSSSHWWTATLRSRSAAAGV